MNTTTFPIPSASTDKPSIRERLRAGGIHGVLSVIMWLAAFYLVYILWYPAPLHLAAGVGAMILILLSADLILGPVLTMIVYKKNRRLLILDLTIILLLQVSAYFYGLYTVAQGRPVWLAFVVDDIELVAAVDIDQRQSEHFKPEYRESLWTGPRWVAALYSESPEVRQQQQDDEIFAGLSLARRPETYAPIEQRANQIAMKQRPLAALERYNAKDRIESELSRYPAATGWMPFKGSALDMVVLVDQKARVLGTVDLRPW